MAAGAAGGDANAEFLGCGHVRSLLQYDMAGGGPLPSKKARSQLAIRRYSTRKRIWNTGDVPFAVERGARMTAPDS
jgi:hypothetical protein